MKQDISFFCPSCGVHLQMPANLAGISGPCPKCTSQITAPKTSQPAPAPAPAPAIPEPEPAHTPAPPQTNQQAPPLQPQQQPTHLLQGGELPPPRAADSRPHHQAPHDHSSDPPLLEEPPSRFKEKSQKLPRRQATGNHRSSSRDKAWMRMVPVIIILLLAIAAIALGLFYRDPILRSLKSLTHREGKASPSSDTNSKEQSGETPPSDTSPEKSNSNKESSPEEPDSDKDPLSTEDIKKSGETHPVPKIDLEENSEPDLEAVEASRKVREKVLATFLEASSLEKRQPYLAPSQYSTRKIANSVLAKKLPPFSKTLLAIIPTKEEGLTEYFYQIVFDTKKSSGFKSFPHSIVIQLSDWGDGTDPKINTDAFLQLYGDVVEKYIAAPQKDPITFHAIIEPARHTFANIPNADSFSNVRVLRENSPEESSEIFRAYFQKKSELATLFSESQKISWGKVALCTITVQWDTKKNPKSPYLELIEVNSFSWAPTTH